MNPPQKKRKTKQLDKGWLTFLTNSQHYLSFTTEWNTLSKQRISINPKYLHHRSEHDLLDVIHFLVKEGDAKVWWISQKYTEERLRLVYREELASMIQKLLHNNEANVKAYMRKMQQIGIARSKDRRKFRGLLLSIKS